MIQKPAVRTQFLIFTLFGEYVLPRGGSAWTLGLLELLEQLKVTERAARSTLSRMSQKGWLVSARVGRYSRYSLTPRGLRVVKEGEVRIFEPRRTQWDGRWHLVVYSIPEGDRRLRGILRQRLGWIGFGRLAPGTWISPTDRREDVQVLIEDLGLGGYAQYFSGTELQFVDQGEIVSRCWPLEQISREYERFLEVYEPAYRAFLADLERGRPKLPAECFVLRFWLTLDYSQFPRLDPNLPAPLQPSGWLGTRANRMFGEFHDLLKGPSEAYASEVLNSDPEAIAVEPQASTLRLEPSRAKDT